MEEKKVGCVLLQGICGGDLSGSQVSQFFNNEAWELSPSKLKLYTLKSQKEFDHVVKITNEAHPMATFRTN